jgi:Histidine kinase
VPVRGDARLVASEDNGHMDRPGDRHAGWAGARRRLTTAPHAPAVAATLLAVAAVAQATARPAGNGQGYGADLQIAYVLLALFTTLPLGLLRVPAVLLAALGPMAAWTGAARRARGEAVLRSAAQRLATPGMPAAGARQLSAIGDTARAALTEMRRLLGVLREDTAPGAAIRRPQPGVRQLNELGTANGGGFVVEAILPATAEAAA